MSASITVGCGWVRVLSAEINDRTTIFDLLLSRLIDVSPSAYVCCSSLARCILPMLLRTLRTDTKVIVLYA